MDLNVAIQISPLARISTAGGDVLHALKKSDSGFLGFGEAYFSTVNDKSIKGWKKHLRMSMNIIVPVGAVRFIFYSEDTGSFRSEIIGVDRYVRMTVPPGIWFAFEGLSEPHSLILNIANIPHDPSEVERCELRDIDFSWKSLA